MGEQSNPLTAEQQRIHDQAVLDVMGERRRQIEDIRFSLEHDDTYTEGELARAAAAYALRMVPEHGLSALREWPWRPETFKPSCTRANLVKAGALILAEIERLDRADIARQEAMAARDLEAPPVVEPGSAWTDAIKARCAARCGDRGDPPCWDLPNLTSDSPPDIQPCSECLGNGEAYTDG